LLFAVCRILPAKTSTGEEVMTVTREEISKLTDLASCAG
jgi:hypothetical protein